MSERSCQPIIEDNLSWYSPLVYGPTFLSLSILILFKRRIYQTCISRFITYLCFFVVFTFVLDSFIIVARIIHNETFNELAYYAGTNWLSWVIVILFLMKGKWVCAFWELAVFMETIVGWTFLLNRSNSTIYDQFSFGIYATRYVVEIAIVILSWIHLLTYNQSEEKKPLFTKQTTTYGSNVVTYTYKIKVQHNFTSLSIKLQLCLLLCVCLMCLNVFVTVLIPRLMGQAVNDFNDWTSILVFIGLTFTQGLLRSLEQVCWVPLSPSLDKSLLELFPVIANTLVITIYTSYIYGYTISSILFMTTAFHIYYILHSNESSSWNMLIESTITSGGLFCGSLLLGYKVATCELDAGDYVAFNMYLIQLQSLYSVRACIERVEVVQELPKRGIVVDKILVEPDRPRMRKIESQIIHIDQGRMLTETIELSEEED